MKCKNCGSEAINREITLITKMGLMPDAVENDPLSPAIGELQQQRTAGWKGRVVCQNCGSEGDWYGSYVIIDPSVAPGTAKHDEAEIDLLRHAHDVLRLVAPPDQTTIPDICRKGNVSADDVHDTYKTFIEAYELLQRDERKAMAEAFAKAMHKDGVIPVMPGKMETIDIGLSH